MFSLEVSFCIQSYVMWILKPLLPKLRILSWQTGFVVDRVKQRHFVMRLFLLSGVLTLGCYLWLASPPTVTKTPIPAIVSFATGHGFSPCKHLHATYDTKQTQIRDSTARRDCPSNRTAKICIDDTRCA